MKNYMVNYMAIRVYCYWSKCQGQNGKSKTDNVKSATIIKIIIFIYSEQMTAFPKSKMTKMTMTTLTTIHVFS